MSTQERTTLLQVAKSSPSGVSVIAKGDEISRHAREAAPRSSALQDARDSSTLATNGHANAGVGIAMARRAKLAAVSQMPPTSAVARTSFTGLDHHQECPADFSPSVRPLQD